ncbi:LysR family transcriptional regulator [Coralliovum pocilloporae]|uniref:LysR family transcriptional regulator n=1 Tax=Coralliovum pocilloporae TaxID=3066369 RepID=UPI00330792FC
MNDISWRSIRAFIEVARHGSFTAAADSAGLSKTSLSQHVSDLEEKLGVQLLHRTTRQLRLTDIGKGYYQRCSQALQQLENARDWAVQSQEGLEGTIHMNAVGGLIGEDIIAPLLIAFQKQHPGLVVHLDFSSIRVDLIAERYDLVLRMGRMPDSTLIARTLQTITTRYVASPDFLKQHGPIREPSDLATLPLIYGSIDHWVLARGDERHMVKVQQGVKVISGRVMRQAALAGLGVTRLADVYVEADIARGDLIEVLPDWSEQTPLSLVCPPLKHQSRRVRALMDFLRLQFGKTYEAAIAGTLSTS